MRTMFSELAKKIYKPFSSISNSIKIVVEDELSTSVYFLLFFAFISGYLLCGITGKANISSESLFKIINPKTSIFGIVASHLFSSGVIALWIKPAIQKIRTDAEDREKENQKHNVNTLREELILEKERSKIAFYSVLPSRYNEFESPGVWDKANDYREKDIIAKVISRSFDDIVTNGIISAFSSDLDHAEEGDMLLAISILSTEETLGISEEDIRSQQKYYSLVWEVYAYLKAWLMKSIEFHQGIKHVDILKQSYPDKSAYVEILKHVQYIICEHKMIKERIGEVIHEEEYVGQAIETMSSYLNQLINILEKRNTCS